MNILFRSKKDSYTIRVKVFTRRPEKIHLRVIDRNIPKTSYTDRYKTVDGKATFYIRMPQAPKEGVLQIWNEDNGNRIRMVDNTFNIGPVEFISLQKKWLIGGFKNGRIKEFMQLATWFSQYASILDAGSGSIYLSKKGKYRIDYVETITDRKSGKRLSTPARINKETGIIQVAKDKFIQYPVPMRVAILLHEFSHFYLNKNQANEQEADRNALNIYLGCGYPRVEGELAFVKVFKKAPTDQNYHRHKAIKKYIENYDYLI